VGLRIEFVDVMLQFWYVFLSITYPEEWECCYLKDVADIGGRGV